MTRAAETQQQLQQQLSVLQKQLQAQQSQQQKQEKQEHADPSRPSAAQWEAQRLLLEQELQDAEMKAAKVQRELQQALAEKDTAADKAVLLQLQLQEAEETAAGEKAGACGEQGLGGRGGGIGGNTGRGAAGNSTSSRDWKLQELERLQEEKRLLTDKVRQRACCSNCNLFFLS